VSLARSMKRKGLFEKHSRTYGKFFVHFNVLIFFGIMFLEIILIFNSN
jgi:hypothetical protein